MSVRRRSSAFAAAAVVVLTSLPFVGATAAAAHGQRAAASNPAASSRWATPLPPSAKVPWARYKTSRVTDPNAAPPAICNRLLAHGPAGDRQVAPTVMASDGDAQWFGLYTHGLRGGYTTALTECAFQDRNGDRRFDERLERSFGYDVVHSVPAAQGYSVSRERIDFRGVREGEQVCSASVTRERPLDGRTWTTRRSVLACYVVAPYMNGSYARP